MKARKLSSERGQAIVLVALGFVVLLGFAALAVDGSMVYADRRFAQNAADAASLAGGSEAAIRLENAYVSFASWNCGGQEINNAIAGAIAGRGRIFLASLPPMPRSADVEVVRVFFRGMP